MKIKFKHCDGQQFRQNQYNDHSPLTQIIVHEKDNDLKMEILVLAWDRHNNVAG